MQISTGLRNALLGVSSLATALANSEIRIYAGTPPASANASIGSATLLCVITVGGTGTGLTFETPAVDGVLVKNSAEVWEGENVASGVATFFRHVLQADDGSSSTTAVRIQGTVGLVGADLNLSSTNLTAAAMQSIDYYAVALPAAA